jgi:molybdopterin molybdotransferase
MKTQPSCEDDSDPNSLSCEEALVEILENISPLKKTEIVPIRNSLGRVLCSDIISPINVPPNKNSAMDGYAFNQAEIQNVEDATLKIIGTAFAGKAFIGSVGRLEAVRIMTGAVVPDHADTIVIQENVTVNRKSINLSKMPRIGDNIRNEGEDIQKNEVILTAGHKVSPADLGLIASIGMAEVEVVQKAKVVYFSTGDELKSLGTTLESGEIYDSNRYTLYGMLQHLDVEIIDMGVVKDTYESIESALLEASEYADMVITSGGVSVGDADFIKEALAKVGQVKFWKIAMKPGRPLAFGKIGKAHFFGLPGNPVSVMIGFHQFVTPALEKISGAKINKNIILEASVTKPLRKRPGRAEYQRGILSQKDNGSLEVEPTGDQGSGILKSMSQANCFIYLPIESVDVAIEQRVRVIPFNNAI